jgi:type I restriction enzyme, S subunit
MSVLLQPKLRFKEFYKDNWKQINLGEISVFATGKPHEKNVVLDGNFNLITLDSIDIKGKLKSKHRKINIDDNSLIKGDLVATLDDLAYTKLIGLSALIPNSGYVLNQRIARLRFKHGHSNIFMHFLINKKQKHFKRRAQGTGVKHIYKRDFNQLLIAIPLLKEQEKIASFLSSVDKKIELLTKKHELLEKFKKGLMQKIFSQEIRFKQGDGIDYPDWVEATLGAIGKFSTSSVDKLNVEGQKLVKLFNYMNVYNHEQIDNKNKKCLMTVSAKDQQINSSNLKKGDILFTPSSETPIDIGHSVVIKEDLDNVLFSYHVVRFRPSINLDLIFENYFCNFTNILRQFSKFSQGATRYTLSIGSFSKVLIKYPSFDEQKKIGLLLSSVDKKIDLAKQQIEKTQTFKKGLLQQMFV